MSGLIRDLPEAPGPDLPEIELDLSEPTETVIDPATGTAMIEQDDGSLLLDSAGINPIDMAKAAEHDANLALFIDSAELSRISEDVLNGIDADEASRAVWLKTIADGEGMLALKVEQPTTGTSGDGAAPVEGMSNYRSPLLLEAVLQFQANARGELLPAAGPVKVRNDETPKRKPTMAPGMGHNGGPPLAGAPMPPPPMMPPAGPPAMPPGGPQMPPNGMPQGGLMPPGMPPGPPPIPPEVAAHIMAMVEAEKDQQLDVLAETLEKKFNHYLTVVDKPYYADTNKMLFKIGFSGAGFKKVYRCPLKRRPVSRAIKPEDLIVSDAEVELADAARVTHKIMMRQSVLKRMQIAGQYRNVELNVPSPPDSNPVEMKEAEIQGIDPSSQLPGDAPHTIYECYCELDIKGFEHKEAADDDGEAEAEEPGAMEPSGLPLPYRVTIDKDSREILEIRRNWKEGDERYIGRMPIVKFSFVDGLGFWPIGLLNILGNSTMAVSMAVRMGLDAGMFASFPGFLYSEVVGRQDNSSFRIPAGGGRKVNTGQRPISDAVMPLPYKDASPGLLAMSDRIGNDAKRVGSIGELQVGEGRQDAPVGTTLAMLDQATKLVSAVHKGLHSSQAEEFALLRDLFIEDPDSLLCGSTPMQREDLIASLNNCNLVPAADPNTPSHTVRVMRAVAMMQFYTLNPGAWDFQDMMKRIATMLNISSIEDSFAKPTPPQALPPDPRIMVKLREIESKEKIAMLENDEKAKDRLLKEKLALFKTISENLRLAQERMQTAGELAVHPDSAGTVDRFLAMQAMQARQPLQQMAHQMQPMPGNRVI